MLQRSSPMARVRIHQPKNMACTAALVKLLRKCIKELGTRASMYVEQCMKVEKDLMKQIETVQLSSDCSVKSLEAELAVAKQNLAKCEATSKMDKVTKAAGHYWGRAAKQEPHLSSCPPPLQVTWGADLESQKLEVGARVGVLFVWQGGHTPRCIM